MPRLWVFNFPSPDISVVNYMISAIANYIRPLMLATAAVTVAGQVFDLVIRIWFNAMAGVGLVCVHMGHELARLLFDLTVQAWNNIVPLIGVFVYMSGLMPVIGVIGYMYTRLPLLPMPDGHEYHTHGSVPSCNTDLAKEDQAVSDTDPDALACRYCRVNRIAVVYRPCGHALCCRTCAAHQQRCMYCRSDVGDRVYMVFG
jgi:hypothetical protein